MLQEVKLESAGQKGNKHGQLQTSRKVTIRNTVAKQTMQGNINTYQVVGCESARPQSKITKVTHDV